MNTKNSSLLVLMSALATLTMPAISVADDGQRSRHAYSGAHTHYNGPQRHAHPGKHKARHAKHWRGHKRHAKSHYYSARPYQRDYRRPVARARYAAHGVYGYHDDCNHGYQAGVNLWLDGFSFSYSGYGRH